MSREIVKCKRFQEILERYVFSISLCEMFSIFISVSNKQFLKEK